MIAHSINDIDVNFDVQTDSGGKDPDYASPTLRSFHQLLWSKLLPNGMMMKCINHTTPQTHKYSPSPPKT